MRLVATGLSRAGYVTVSTIIGLENVLDEVEGFVSEFDRERGRDPGLYYVRVFGVPDGTARGRGGSGGTTSRSTTPSSTARWSARRRASSAPTRRRRRCSARTCCGRSPGPRTSPASSSIRSTTRSAPPAPVARRARSTSSPANRPRVSEGDDPLPLTDIWRRRFDGELGERMAAVQQAAERNSGLRPEHLAAVRFTTAPKGIPAADLGPDQRELLRALLDVYVRRIPDELADAESAKYRADERPRRSCRSRGPAASSPASRTTTGSRAGACWPSTTTPSAASTTSTRCGATSNRISVATPSPSTTPSTTTITTPVNGG